MDANRDLDDSERAKFASIETETRSIQSQIDRAEQIARLEKMETGNGIKFWLPRSCPILNAGSQSARLLPNFRKANCPGLKPNMPVNSEVAGKALSQLL